MLRSILQVVTMVVLAFIIPENTRGTYSYKRFRELKLNRMWTALRTASVKLNSDIQTHVLLINKSGYSGGRSTPDMSVQFLAAELLCVTCR